MRIVVFALILLIALFHSYIAYFEIFAWETTGARVFSTFPNDLFGQTKILAANQGIYNAFLVAGLIWSLLIRDRVWQTKVATCFLVFVAVAGIFGGATVSIRIFVLQAMPAIIALILLHLNNRRA